MSAALPLDPSYVQTAVSGIAPSRPPRRFVGLPQPVEQRTPLYFARQGAPEAEDAALSASPVSSETDSAREQFSQWLSVGFRFTRLDATTQLLWANRPASDESEAPTRKHERIVRSIETAAADAQEADWDSYGAKQASTDSTKYAIEFVRRMPASLPVPDVLVDRDGEINLEWYCNPSQVFSVSFSPKGELSYAGLFSSGKVHGSELLGRDSLSEIIHNIKRVWRG